MANDLNQCNFIGRLGRDPEENHMPSGDTVCNFSIAVGWKTKDKEGTEWVNIVAFGKLGEICADYLKKGAQVMISGRFHTREWEKDGVKRYSTEIVAERMQMLGSKPESAQKNDGGKGYQAAREGRHPAPSGGFADMDDDIPFAPISSKLPI